MDYWRRNSAEEDWSILMEESGDSSEGHSDDPEKMLTTNGASSGVVVMNYGDVDDAESCSSESCTCDHALLDYDDDDDDDDDDIEICVDDHHHQEQGEEDHDHDQQQPPAPQEKYCNADESSEVMDAMEDRLFWETCLAVGFSSKP